MASSGAPPEPPSARRALCPPCGYGCTGFWQSFLLNRADINNIQYSLKKLEAAGLVSRTREVGSKTHLFVVTPEGARITDAYAALRRRLLIPQIEMLGDFQAQLTQTARVLSMLIGIYEEQARAAGTFDRADVMAMTSQG